LKVLFISHPDVHRQKPDFPPIGIAYLGAVVHQKGYDVKLIDSALTTINNIVEQAKKYSPDVIGVTCWTINRKAVWHLCAKLKEQLPGAFLIIGGPHASYYPEHMFIKTNADAVVIGEGENTIVELLAELENGGCLSKVKGIIFRGKDGKIVKTQAREQIECLDSIPLPYYDGFEQFNLENYSGLPWLTHPTAAIITSRGCIYDCSYCGSVNFWGKHWRYRSAQNVLEEIKYVVNNLGAKSIYFFDDNFPVNKQRAKDICSGIIDMNISIEWGCCSHVKMINEELLGYMKESGCVSIDFGVESGSNKILKNINKKQTRADIELAFALSHKFGIKPRAYLMVGNKGETENTIDETIEMIARIKPFSSIGATLLWLLPGTLAFSEARTNGFIKDDYWLTSDDVPYNLQEYSYKELFTLRQRLIRGIAIKKGGILSLVTFYLKSIYYRFPFLARIRSLIPNLFK
jgi:radical SAM superfamily enzyme YgiQ (UPF0313 family)